MHKIFRTAPVTLGVALCITTTGCNRPNAEAPSTAAPVATDKGKSASTKPASQSHATAAAGKSAAKPDKIASGTPPKESGRRPVKGTLKDFPTDVALYKGAKVLGIGTSPKGVVAGMETKDAPQKVMDYYNTKLPVQGWTVKSATTTKTGGVLQCAKSKRQCFVTVGVNPKTKVTVFSVSVVNS